MIKLNKTKRLLHNDKPAIGTFAFLPEPGVVEIVGLAGFDFVIIDNEHTVKDFKVIEAMIRATEAVDITPIVRVHQADT